MMIHHSIFFCFGMVGSLLLCKKGTIDLTNINNGSDYKTTKILVEFPWPASSMNQIESCIKSKPLISHLSLSPLPETDCPYSYLQDASTMHGTIYESIWQKWHHNHWLSMAEMQLFSALMMRNTTENKFVHVFSPSITKIMQNAF